MRVGWGLVGGVTSEPGEGCGMGGRTISGEKGTLTERGGGVGGGGGGGGGGREREREREREKGGGGREHFHTLVHRSFPIGNGSPHDHTHHPEHPPLPSPPLSHWVPQM